MGVGGVWISMDSVIDKAYRGLKVPLRALQCKARSLWRVAWDKPPREKKQDKIYIEVNVLICNPVNGRYGVGS